MLSWSVSHTCNYQTTVLSWSVSCTYNYQATVLSWSVSCTCNQTTVLSWSVSCNNNYQTTVLSCMKCAKYLQLSDYCTFLKCVPYLQLSAVLSWSVSRTWNYLLYFPEVCPVPAIICCTFLKCVPYLQLSAVLSWSVSRTCKLQSMLIANTGTMPIWWFVIGRQTYTAPFIALW